MWLSTWMSGHLLPSLTGSVHTVVTCERDDPDYAIAQLRLFLGKWLGLVRLLGAGQGASASGCMRMRAVQHLEAGPAQQHSVRSPAVSSIYACAVACCVQHICSSRVSLHTSLIDLHFVLYKSFQALLAGALRRWAGRARGRRRRRAAAGSGPAGGRGRAARRQARVHAHGHAGRLRRAHNRPRDCHAQLRRLPARPPRGLI